MTTATQRIVTVLVYADIAAAHDFLVDTFGFTSGGIHRDDAGQVVHGEVSLDGEAIWLHRASPDPGLRDVTALGSATGMLNVFVEDVDAHHGRAAAAPKSFTRRPTSPTASASTAPPTPKDALVVRHPDLTCRIPGPATPCGVTTTAYPMPIATATTAWPRHYRASLAELTDGEQDRRIFECFEGVAGVGDDE
jgi:uncharacterized glyoxalase superfamily protein PhnB